MANYIGFFDELFFIFLRWKIISRFWPAKKVIHRLRIGITCTARNRPIDSWQAGEGSDNNMQEKKMTNCPACQKPVLNEGQFTAFTQFNIRCPWCQATMTISVQPRIVAELVKAVPKGTPSTTPRFKLVGYVYPEDQSEESQSQSQSWVRYKQHNKERTTSAAGPSEPT